MRRRSLLVLLVAAFAGCGSPAAPEAGTTSLSVRVLDESTGTPILDSVYAVAVQLVGPQTYTQAAVSGTAEFPSIAPGDYVVTASVLFGYIQLDYLKVSLSGPKTMTVPLTPIDDLGVQEVIVDGQGSIQRGGTINVPASGVTIHFRGKYRSSRSPWPIVNLISASPESSVPGAFAHDSDKSVTVSSASDFEVTETNFVPCHQAHTGSPITCYTQSDVIHLVMTTPSTRIVIAKPLAIKDQPWPLKFVLGAGCCAF
jgi:hypothetical protein